jgi:hypothetical protein
MQRRSVRQRTLVPLLALFWRTKGNKTPTLQKSDLLRVECVDLELRAQERDVRRQLDEYDRSREPEVRGKWNKVCGKCGYVNHERHRYCESCGCDMFEKAVHEVVHICPKCRTTVAKHVRECGECGARFWSPIILTRSPVGKCQTGEDEAREGRWPNDQARDPG